MDPDFGPAEDPAEHLGLPGIDLAGAAGSDQLVGIRSRLEDAGEGPVAGDPVAAGGGQHDDAARGHHPLGRGHAFDRLIEVAVEGMAPVGGEHHVEAALHRLGDGTGGELAGGHVAVRQPAGEDPGEASVAVDGDVHREIRWAQGGGGPDEIVDRIAFRYHPGGTGVGQAGRAVGLEDGGRVGQPRADGFGSPAPPGEEMGFDEPGHDADAGVDVAVVEQDRHTVHRPHPDMTAVVGVVVVDAVAPGDGRADQLLHLGPGGLAVGPGGTQQLHPLRPGPGPFELGQERRQHRGVGHRTGEVGEDDGDPTLGTDQVGQRRGGDRVGQRLTQRSGLVGQGRRLLGPDHHGVIGHVDLQPVGAVGQGQPHADTSGAADGPGRFRPITAAATRSASPRRPA